MPTIAQIILPVAAYIGAGLIAAKIGLVSAKRAKQLNDIVLYVFMPPFLFKAVQSIDGSVDPRGAWSAYYLSVIVIWVFTGLFLKNFFGLSKAGGSGAAFSATFGNIGFMGLPIGYLAFGHKGTIIIAMIIAVHATFHWTVCTIWAALSVEAERLTGIDLTKRIVFSLIKNPILLALIVGGLWALSGLEMPESANQAINFGASLAVPTGLFALGLSIAAYSIRDNVKGAFAITATKMMLFPVVTYCIARFGFDLSETQVAVLTLTAGMPTGINAYLFAVQYDANIGASSSAIASGVMASMVTLPILMVLLGV